ncbi:MAG: hypothetical protein RLY20_3140 [Verrucomicrobiota bacterium]|jgi:tRNA U34 5-methylaminomethyl-2-thiouridine-forming methyltransferase MnmC
MSDLRYQLVRLRNGAVCVRSVADDETFHPGIGPVAEAEALYVRQLRLPERVRETEGEFVIWDIGLGAAANALTAIKLLADQKARLRLVSFDHTCDALLFAVQHAAELGYPLGFEAQLSELVANRRVQFHHGELDVDWTLMLGDFPTALAGQHSPLQPVPHAILFDPHSPQKNPAMWTVPLFANLFRQLDPQRPCALANFTRSTLARAAMLLGGFYVGVGHASGLKEETTVAANRLELLAEPLNQRWLERARRSDSAEPLWEPVYRRAKLSDETRAKLQEHPQFKS